MAKFWELFKRLEELPAQEVQSVVIKPQTADEALKDAFLNSKGLRRAMWVMTPAGIGIVTGVRSGTVEVMLVDDAGLNKQKEHFETGKLRQAKVLEIPRPRRPDEATAKARGYL